MTVRRATLLGVVLASAAACVSGRDCARAIPEDLRADAIRFALDRKLCDQGLLPQQDLDLALGVGQPYAAMTESRRSRLAPYATGYASCLRERVDRR